MNSCKVSIIWRIYRISSVLFVFMFDISLLFLPHFNCHAESETATSVTIEFAQPSSDSIIKRGSQGDEVRWLQSVLNQVIDAGLTVDGDFGTKTEKALKLFQSQNDLEPNGIADNNTIYKLSQYIIPNTESKSITNFKTQTKSHNNDDTPQKTHIFGSY